MPAAWQSERAALEPWVGIASVMRGLQIKKHFSMLPDAAVDKCLRNPPFQHQSFAALRLQSCLISKIQVRHLASAAPRLGCLHWVSVGRRWCVMVW
jgi:hypothetical protein